MELFCAVRIRQNKKAGLKEDAQKPALILGQRCTCPTRSWGHLSNRELDDPKLIGQYYRKLDAYPQYPH